MILTSVRVENFKCIQDTGEFAIDRVTCLVGKNESGKSATMQALHRLNADTEAGYNDVVEYPRTKWLEYRRRRKENPDNVLTTIWDAEEKELEMLRELVGPNALRSPKVIVRKGYDQVRHWQFDLDESQVVAHYVDESQLYEEDAQPLKENRTVASLVSALESKGQLPERQKRLLERVKEAFPDGQVTPVLAAVGEEVLPTFLYFADYYRLRGTISVDNLIEKKEKGELDFEDLVFLALLDIAGTTPEELYEIGEFEELVAELEAVSNRLSEQIFQYWSQNDMLEVDFNLDAGRPNDPPPFNQGYVFRTRIRNRRHGVTVSFDERSAGFVWFFSFLVWFSQVRKIYGDNLVILLDEPGLNLHARAQADLLRYIDVELAPYYQVMLTTHSPFMVNPEKLSTVRTVEDIFKDDKVLGTKVSNRSHDMSPDTVLPLQTALGFHISKNLFVDQTAILVESPSDLLYLNWFRRDLSARNRETLDSRWVITPIGGVSEMGSFLALFGGEKACVAAIASKRHVSDNPYDTDVIGQPQAKLLFIEDYVERPEADLEDLMGWASYADLVNRTYSLGRGQRLPLERPEEARSSIVEDVTTYFTQLPSYLEYDRLAPAEFLLQRTNRLRNNLAEFNVALDSFERLFHDLNELLRESDR